VTFVLFSDSSGATLKTLNGTATDTTDASGKVVAIYTAGINNPTLNVQDTVKAGIVGASTAIIMTRTGSGGGGGGGVAGGVKMEITAVPSKLPPGQMSVIVAKASNADGFVVGQTVNFGFVVNNSRATLTVIRAKTDSTGTAIATYTAGNGSPGISIQDAVTASVTDATGTYSAGAVIITVDTPAAAGTGNRITLTGSVGRSSAGVVKATVMRDDGSTRVMGVAVTFGAIVKIGGFLTDPLGIMGDPLTVLTDANGEAYVIFTSTAVAGYAAIRATITGGDAAVVLIW